MKFEQNSPEKINHLLEELEAAFLRFGMIAPANNGARLEVLAEAEKCIGELRALSVGVEEFEDHLRGLRNKTNART